MTDEPTARGTPSTSDLQRAQAHFRARVASGDHQRSTIASALKCKAKFRGNSRKLAKLDQIIAKHARSLPASERKILVPRSRPVVARAITIRTHRSTRVSSVSATASDSSGGDDDPSGPGDPPLPAALRLIVERARETETLRQLADTAREHVATLALRLPAFDRTLSAAVDRLTEIVERAA